MSECVIVDIDGTVANLNHRLHHITDDLKNYKEFYADLANDTPITDNLRIIHHLAGTWPIIFCSGRPEDYRAETEQWLNKNYGLAYKLFMRPKGDFRSDHIIKAELLEKIKAADLQPVLVIDDRPRVIQMWREKGLTCWDVGGWDNWRGRRKYVWNAKAFGKDQVPLTLMVGPAGAGKSTYAKKHFSDHSVLVSDEIREWIGGYDPKNNAQVFSIFHDLAKARLQNGLPVVLDATHIYRQDRLASVGLVPVDVPVKYIVVQRPLKEKYKTGGWRLEVGFDLIAKHDEVFNQNLKYIEVGDGLPNVTVEFV